MLPHLRHRIFLTASFLLLLIGDQAPANEVDLKPVLRPAHTYRFLTKTEVSMTPPGAPTRQFSAEHQIRLDVGLRQGEHAGVSVKAVTEKLKVVLQSGERQITYDSLVEKDKSTPLGRHLQTTLHRWVEMNLDENFRVVSSEEKGRMGESSPLPGLPQFGPEELIQLVSALNQGFTKPKAKPGDEWTFKGSRPLGHLGSLTFDMAYRYIGAAEVEGNNCAQIDMDGHLAGDVTIPGPAGSPFSRGQLDFQDTQVSGKIYFDLLEQTVRLSEQELIMKLKIPGNAGSEPTEVPMTQKVTVQLMHTIATGTQ